MAIKFIKTTDIGSHKSKDGDLELHNFKKLNIFVGKNNSGKSRFLRHLLRNRKYLIDSNASYLYKNISDLYTSLSTAYPQVISHEGFFIKDLRDILKVESQEFPQKIVDIKSKAQMALDQNGDTTSAGASRRNIAQIIINAFNSEKFLSINEKESPVMYAYVPILRGLRPLVKDTSSPVEKYTSEDCYKDRTKFDYFEKGLGEDAIIFSGLDLYEQITDMLLSSKREERDFVVHFQEFLSKHFFNDNEIILTPTKDRDVITISIGGDEKPIYDLGDGIQSIICNVFLAYKNKDKNLVLFIEEPEMFLHPGMQRTLIEVLLRELEHVQIFLTTHSNHFLDLIYDYQDDVTIYAFEKKGAEFFITNITRNKDVIDILGIRNSSVYLSNCVIWVEGVSDRIYLKKFIELYIKEKNIKLKEDYHFAICEYGGSNIENFDFIGTTEGDQSVRVNSISNKNFIVADNDGNKGKNTKKAQRLEKLSELLGNSFYDDYIEIENLIPYKIYKPMIEGLLPEGNGKSIKMKPVVVGVEKKFNDQIKIKKIGFVLKKYLIEKKNEEDPAYFKNDSIECLGEGKKYLADLVIKEIDNSKITFSELPLNTQNFVNSVISFIRSKNE